MKYLIILTSLVLTACGGGSGGEPDPAPTPPTPTPPAVVLDYGYAITTEGDTRQYSGRCRRVTDTLYCHPEALADSPYVVTAEIVERPDGSHDVRLFSYITRELTAEFNTDGAHSYTLTLTERAPLADRSLDGIWSEPNNAGIFGEAIVWLEYSEGFFEGGDTAGCTINGGVEDGGGAWAVVEGCAAAGNYYGALTADGDDLRGALFSASHGLPLFFKL